MTLAIYCAGGLGKEVLALARSVSRWQYIIFVDDTTDNDWIEGAKVFRFDDVKDFPDNVEFVIANGEPKYREKLYKRIIENGYTLATIIGNGCTILPDTTIGKGCILYDCGVSTGVNIGDNVIINTKACIGHDANIKSHSVVSAFCFIGGFSTIGYRNYLAPGSMIKDRINIGDDTIISLGAVVLRNVREKSIMIGNPAKKIGENLEGIVFGAFS